MSTIAENLQALQQAKSDIADAITNKGGTVNSGDGFADFATDIGTIPTGAQVTLEDKTVSLDMASGNQEVSPSSGYDALSKVTVTKPATLIPENIKKDENVGGVVGTFAGTPIANDLDGLVDGSITSFIMPSGITTVRANLFQYLLGLTSADLTGATTIADYAFDACANAAITLPSTLTSIGQYAFRNVRGGFMILNCPNSPCSVGTYAFNGATVQKVLGKFSTIGDYAFYNNIGLTEADINECTSVNLHAFSGLSAMTKLHIAVNGTIKNYAFQNANYVNDLSITGIITGTLGQYAFQQLGYLRSNPDQNILVIDFTNSTFTSVGGYCFYGSSSNYGLRYMDITFPTTCTSFGSQCFQYMQNSDLWFTRTASVPTIQSNTFSGISNTNLWVPYDAVTAYRTATNWAAQSANIKGYAPANTFQQGDTLPTMTSEYYGYTWYSDKAMTNVVTTVTDPTQKYYCSVGTTVLYYEVGAINTVDCTVTISDGTNNYTTGDIVATGTSLTISTAGTDPTKPAVYMLSINGTDYAPASSETITVADDITVTAMYWDEEHTPINPVFGDNPWWLIREVTRAGTASNYWSVGDTKSVTLANGSTTTVRIADMLIGRYALADGNGSSNMVLEFIGLVGSLARMNSSSETTGGWASCPMRTTTMPERLALLPQDLQDAISEVVVLGGRGGTSYTSGVYSSNDKLFLACEEEIFGTTGYWAGEAPSGQFGYYATHNTDNDRIKGFDWWLRTPVKSSYKWGYVSFAGSRSNAYPTDNKGVSPIFAI